MAKSRRYLQPKNGPCTINAEMEKWLEEAQSDWLNTTLYKSIEAAAQAHNAPYHTLIRRIDGLLFQKSRLRLKFLVLSAHCSTAKWLITNTLAALPLNGFRVTAK